MGTLAAVGAIAFLLAMPGGGRDDIVALAYGALDQPSKILHFRELFWTGSPRNVTTGIEAWRATRGSRERVITDESCQPVVVNFHPLKIARPWRCGARQPATTPPAASGTAKQRFGPPWWETVIDGRKTRVFRADTNPGEIFEVDQVEYADKPNEVPGVIDGVADPRTFLRAARDGRADVRRLPSATVRGRPVLRFQVGRCRWVMKRVRMPVSGGRIGMRPWPHIISTATIFWVSRRDYLPVRIEWPTCGPKALVGGARVSGVDYPTFDVLPANAANRRLLEMSAHPGARVVHGH
jgi:hypothetical protein